MLDCTVPPAAGTPTRSEERGALMRVLAVTQLFGALEDDVKCLRQRVGAAGTPIGIGPGLVQPTNYRGIVGRSVGEGGACQPATRVVADDAIPGQLPQDNAVVTGMNDHRDVRAVLRRGSDHRRAAHVHGLYRRLRLERVQVANDKVDRGDVLSGKVVDMGLDRPVGQNAGMNGRVQGFHATVEHLGNARDQGNFCVIDPGCREGIGGAAARDQLDAESGETARELLEPRLVVYRKKRTHPRRRYQRGAEQLDCRSEGHGAARDKRTRVTTVRVV